MDSKSMARDILKASIIVFLLLFPHFVPLPFYSYAIVCLAVIVFYLRQQKRSLGDLGLKQKGPAAHAFLIGIVSAALWVCFNKWVYHPFITHFFDVPPYTEYDFIRNNLSNLIITIAAAWIVGGLYEEIVFRGFIHSVLEGWFKKYRFSFWAAALVTSILFGLYHWQQGIFGMVPSFLGGILWSFLLKRYNRNLWYPVMSHALYDTIALILIYFGMVI